MGVINIRIFQAFSKAKIQLINMVVYTVAYACVVSNRISQALSVNGNQTISYT